MTRRSLASGKASGVLTNWCYGSVYLSRDPFKSQSGLFGCMVLHFFFGRQGGRVLLLVLKSERNVIQKQKQSLQYNFKSRKHGYW